MASNVDTPAYSITSFYEVLLSALLALLESGKVDDHLHKTFKRSVRKVRRAGSSLKDSSKIPSLEEKTKTVLADLADTLCALAKQTGATDSRLDDLKEDMMGKKIVVRKGREEVSCGGADRWLKNEGVTYEGRLVDSIDLEAHLLERLQDLWEDEKNWPLGAK